MSRLFTRIYVELVGAIGLIALAGVVWIAQTETGLPALVAGIPWLVALALILGPKAAPSAWVARTRRHPWWAYATAIAASLGAAVVSPLAGGISAMAVVALLGYTLWYTRQHQPQGVIVAGAPLPHFPLLTVDGDETSSERLAHEPHVILFYRGSWCPFCVAQVKAVAEQYRELNRRGVRVALISAQRARDTEELSRQFEAPMDFYVDADGAAARMLDIVQEGGTPVTFGAGTNGDTVVPTVIITRADGTVAWVHHAQDHRVRPEPSLFLEVIDREGIAVTRRDA